MEGVDPTPRKTIRTPTAQKALRWMRIKLFIFLCFPVELDARKPRLFQPVLLHQVVQGGSANAEHIGGLGYLLIAQQ
jgi:hypothetical protein